MSDRELACATRWDLALGAHLGVLLDGQVEVWDCRQAHSGGHPADHPSQALDCAETEKARLQATRSSPSLQPPSPRFDA
jgi:hypothetical protein